MNNRGRDAYRRAVTRDDIDNTTLMDAARYAILRNLKSAKARWLIATACDRLSPENVYMDGELWSYR